jgi:L-fuculose-phosphate aldolase
VGDFKMSFERERKEIIYWGRILNQKKFISAKNGNISCKINSNKILITAHDAYLGYLEEKEVLLADLEGNILRGDLALTAEKNLHLNIHRKFKDIKVVFHAHPTYTTAFFHYFNELDIFSFETKFYLGNIKVIPQETPAVTEIEPVLEALDSSNIVVLKNHGVVSIGGDFKDAFSLIELLEEQAKVNLLIKSQILNPKSQINTKSQILNDQNQNKPKISKRYKLLSEKHIQRLVEVINSDKEAQQLGKKYELTCTLAVKNQDTGKAVCFYYDKGKIVNTDGNDKAEFLIIGNEDILRKVFNREIDPFVASTQGKVKTKGDFSKMSRWYPVLVRTFKLWEQAPVE